MKKIDKQKNEQKLMYIEGDKHRKCITRIKEFNAYSD